MRAIFNFLTVNALRFRFVTLALMVLVILAGGVAATELNQELLPPIEFPQTIILAQASGITSEQALAVLTERLEAELDRVPDIVNIESTTSSTFGALITARNDFGIDQEHLLREIQAAVDNVWLPQRRISPDEGQDQAEFVADLLGDVDAELLIYLQQRDSNFLFQLSPDVWASLSDETLQEVLAYLANQVAASDADKSALRRLVEQEIAPQLTAIDVIANVQVSGGQVLPGEAAFAEVEVDESTEARSLLLQLSPDVWDVIYERVGGAGSLDTDAVALLRDEPFPAVEGVPVLPESWQRDHFNDASDLLEVRTLTTTIAGIFNKFYADGRIVGALGQTDDLTPETVTQLLEIEPSMVQYLEAEHLVAMPADVFAVLPEDYISGLDGFTRDALAAAALAERITGEQAEQEPVNLPSQWRIQPPQLLTFSFADIPLASYSVYTRTTETASVVTDEPDAPVEEPENTTTEETVLEEVTLPEGPALPPLFGVVGGFLGTELNTADDLIGIALPEETAAQFGGGELRAADFFNFLVILGNPEALPEGVEVPQLPINPTILISGISPEAIAFIIENDETFLPNLSADVYDAFSDAVLALPEVSPPLAGEWDALSSQPQFSARPFRNAQDLVEVGNGSPSTVLNTINETIPERFAGYEVRLFNSLTPSVLRYFALNEADFYSNLETAVLLKLSPVGLSAIPEPVIDGLDEDVQADLNAIVSGEQPSAFDDLRELYSSDVPPADPDAPVLNEDWGVIANFLGVELDTADDFFRFYPGGEVEFLNSFFDSAQGVAFAPNLFGGLSADALDYMAERDPNLLNELRIEALQLLAADVLAGLPANVQERAAAGGEPFRPTDPVTRLNGANSLLVTIYKDKDANTVQAHYAALEVIRAIEAQNEDIAVDVAFEQSSFVEESISGVAREGTTGAIFAMIIILLFLSGGNWNLSRRRVVGLVMTVLFAAILGVLISSELGAAGGDINQAFARLDNVTRILTILGLFTGLVVWVAPVGLPIPAWRATLVIGVSIPLSIFAAFALMRWLPPAVNGILAPLAEDSAFFAFLIRLFPQTLTLNIMTLSGLTVAVGRIVDDSIVVLENSFRHIQMGGDKKQAIITGAREVSSAIFTATIIAVVVFLPLGLTGGLIGEFFLPFGLAVTYSLLSSFLVAIIVVPVLMYLFISVDDAPEDGDIWVADYYLPVLRWSLRGGGTRWIVIILAFASMVFGGVLFGTRPAAFLPDFGEQQITVNVTLPSGTSIVDTNALVLQLEEYINENVPADQLDKVQVLVGSGGLTFESLFTGSSVQENRASVTVAVRASEEQLEAYTEDISNAAASIFGAENVDSSLASQSSGGFGGFALVVSGPIEDLEAYNNQIIEAIESVEGITNVTSNLTAAEGESSDSENNAVTYLRVDRETALSYSGELDTENTIGVTTLAIEAIESIPDFPETLSVSQGFESELQTEGFVGLFVAMGLAIIIVVVILVFYLGSPLYWMAILGSVLVAPVGAAVALTLTDRVLGISALIGLLMLIGLVITNAIVLIDRVRQNNLEKNMPLYDSLIEAGGRRLRPILMTALATIIALIPLALGWGGGGLIAEELGTVVIGGVLSSTLLTLIVVPVAYSLLTPAHRFLVRLVRPNSKVRSDSAVGGSTAD